MYFVDNGGNVKKHIGPNDASKPVYIKSTTLCGNGASISNPQPSCETPPYTHSIKVMRSVLWDVSGNDEIVMMNILICGEQIE